MKKFKPVYITAIAFLCVITFFFGSVCYRFYRAKRYFDYGNVSSESSKIGNSSSTVSYDWSKKYPFDESQLYNSKKDYKKESFAETEVKETETEKEESSNYLSVVNGIKDSIDYYTTMLLPGRIKYVEANARFNKTVGMNIIVGTDSVIVMKNGYLTFENSSVLTGAGAAESLDWFDKALEKRGIDFAYIQYPTKEKKDDNVLPAGAEDNSNKNADKLLTRLSNKGIKFVDMRTLLSQKDDDWYSNFFKTDHHWKPETGVWAAGKIIEMLNSDFGYSLDSGVGDISRYNVDVYKNYCLGSQGKIATLTYADPEDISLIYPKKKTNMTVTYNTDTPKTGRFEDVLFNTDSLNDDYYNTSVYSTYLSGNKALTTIMNNDCKNGIRILVIGDSYNKCVVPYLSQAVENIDLLDRRYFDGSVLNYIDQTKPDVVLVAYTPTLIDNAEGHNSPYNFE